MGRYSYYRQTIQHIAVSTTRTSFCNMISYRVCCFHRRWQRPYALSILLFMCIISWIVALRENDVNVSPVQRSCRRQLSTKSAIRPLPSLVQQQDRSKHNILRNKDPQHVSNPDTFPHHAVGLLHWNDDVTCTSTLVAPNIVLTAAECVLGSNGQLRGTSRDSSSFSLPQRADIQPAAVTRVHKQSDYWTGWIQNTYVLVELDVDLGTTIGVLHLPNANSFTDEASLTVELVDFGNKEEDGECSQLCTVHLPTESNGPEYMVHHDCDISAKRSPGAPMLASAANLDTYIIGIHTNAISYDANNDTHAKNYPSYSIANHGVLGSLVQPHLSFLLRPVKSTISLSDEPTSHGDSEVSRNETSISSSSSFITNTSHAWSTYQRHTNNQTNAVASAALAQSPATSTFADASTGAPHIDSSTAVVYSCIGLVSASWLAIILVVARRIRSSR